MIKLRILLVLICFFTTINISGQVYLKQYTNKRMKPDSLFEKFTYPGLPPVLHSEIIDFIYYGKYYVREIYVSVYVVHYKDNIKYLVINPLYNIGNEIPKGDKFWTMLEDSIRTAVKQWKPKTWYYPLGYQPENPYINKNSEFRPYRGFQTNFITLKWTFDDHLNGMWGLTYWLDIPYATIPPSPEEE